MIPCALTHSDQEHLNEKAFPFHQRLGMMATLVATQRRLEDAISRSVYRCLIGMSSILCRFCGDNVHAETHEMQLEMIQGSRPGDMKRFLQHGRITFKIATALLQGSMLVDGMDKLDHC